MRKWQVHERWVHIMYSRKLDLEKLPIQHLALLTKPQSIRGTSLASMKWMLLGFFQPLQTRTKCWFFSWMSVHLAHFNFSSTKPIDLYFQGEINRLIPKGWWSIYRYNVHRVKMNSSITTNLDSVIYKYININNIVSITWIKSI